MSCMVGRVTVRFPFSTEHYVVGLEGPESVSIDLGH